MNMKLSHIISFSKHFAIIIVLYAIVVQPVTQALDLLSQAEYELVNIDLEEDSSEDEFEKEDKNKKIATQLPYKYPTYIQKFKDYNNNNLLCKFLQEILIPPPKQA